MKTQTLRAIIIILMTVVMMLYFHTDRQKEQYSKSAEPAVVRILSEISTWQKQALLTHLAPEAQQAVGDEKLDQLLDLYRSFGRFHSIDELEFSRTVSALSLVGERRINYSGVAKYDAGLVNVNITLVERGGFFLVYNFSLARAS